MLVSFFVTGPTDVATEPNHLDCGICRKDVSVLTHGHHGILRHFQGSKPFPRDQRLRLETIGWEMFDYEGNSISPREVERQWKRIKKAPLVVRDRKCPFVEDVIVDNTGAMDLNLGIMVKISPLIEVLRLGGSYDLVYQLWTQFTLSAVLVTVDVTSSRDDVLVSISIFPVLSTSSVCF